MGIDVSPQANFEAPCLAQIFSSHSLQSRSRRQLAIGTWNVKGLTDIKIFTICMYMRKYGIDIICLQETWVPQAEYYYEGGYKVILSGSDGTHRSWSGVGFVVAPWCTHRIHGFLQFSDRMASLKLKVSGGKVGIITGYAPHNLKPYDERHDFYINLGKLWEQTSVNGHKYLFGDFNARIGFQKAGEHEVFGPFGFGREAVHQVDVPNRDLLFEFCTGLDYSVGNMFLQTPPDQKMTFVQPGSAHASEICPGHSAMLDLALLPRASLHDLISAVSIREAALATDHFLVFFALRCDIEPRPQTQHRTSVDRAALQNPIVKQQFTSKFVEAARFDTEAGTSVEDSWKNLSKACAAGVCEIPQKAVAARKPWIGPVTLSLINDRHEARGAGNSVLERSINKAVHKSARADKAVWLNSVLEDGAWEGIRKLRQPRKPNQGRLQDVNGDLVSSECRADTMATYLESIQWRVRPATLTDGPLLGPELPVSSEDFTCDEVSGVLRKLRFRKAAGPDSTPAEYLKALLGSSVAVQLLTDFFNQCYQRQELPSEWHHALVSAIHKKGRVDHCENYRPISLLNVWYKVYAALVHKRLVNAGAEERLSETQFGFRSKRSTLDAIFVLRRRVDLAGAQRDGQVFVMALDWAKAFDSICPESMLAALRRFGLTEHVLGVIAAIYSSREFRVRDCGLESSSRPQHSGISQGCPLSPFLFVMLMTVLMRDAADKLPPGDQELLRQGSLAELLYADDTLLLSVSADSLERFLAAVSSAGSTYGLELHWGKLQLIKVRCSTAVHRPDLSTIEPQSNLLYLGSLVSDDGRISSELARRLGMASGEFRKLSRLWRHSRLGRARKIEIFAAVVVTILMYGLAAAWLNKGDQRKLNGFQNRCLRTIWGIKPAYVSRVSNARVLEITGQRPLTALLQKQQLLLYGKVAPQSDANPMRAVTFGPGSLRPAVDLYVRKVGRPRLAWAPEVGKLALQAAGGLRSLDDAIADESAWRSVVETFINK